MSNLKLLCTILRLKSLKITDFRFMHRDKELHLAVKPYKNGCRCPECGRRGRIVHQTTELRRWEDLALMGLRLVLWYAPKEIQCPTHGRVQEEIPWAPAYARVTYRLEWPLRPVPDHDAEGGCRDPAAADLDPVQPAAPGHHAGAPRAYNPRPDHARGRTRSPTARAGNSPPSSTTWTGRGSCGSAPARAALPSIASSTTG